MHQIGTLRHLEASTNQLSGSELLIIEGILSDPGRIVSESIHEVARRCGVSESTIVRTCKKLGFAGYPDMKMAIAVDLASANTSPPTGKFLGEVKVDDPPEAIIQKVFEANLQALRKTLAHMDNAAFKQALDLVFGANRIGVFASGTQSHIVDHCVSKLTYVGANCIGRVDHLQQVQLVSNLGPEDVIIFFSNSGRVKTQVHVAGLARARGIKMIAFTSYPQSPLARLVDVMINTYQGDTDIYFRFMSSHATRIVMLDALLVAIATRKGESALATLRESREGLKEFMY